MSSQNIYLYQLAEDF